MKSKRVLASILSVLLVAQTMVFIPTSAEDTTEDTISSTETVNDEETDETDETEDYTITVEWSKDDAHTLVVTTDGTNVTLTEDDVWKENSNVSKDRVFNLVIGEGFSQIGRAVFSDCIYLESVKLPTSIESIGRSAFGGCTSLTDINFDECDKLVFLGKWSFSNTGFTEITLPDNILFLGSDTVYTTTEDEDGNTSEDVGAVNISEVSDDEVTNIFNHMAELYDWSQQVINSIASLGTDINNILANIMDTSEDGSVFADCKNLTTVHLSKNMTYLPMGTFKNCTKLTTIGDVEGTITIPENIRVIGSNAFKGCSSITDVYIPDSVFKIQDDGGAGNIDVDSGPESDKGGAFSYCTNLKSVRMSSTLKTIPMGIFFECTNLETLEIPEGVTIIECDAFYNCESLDNIVLPNSLTKVGAFAFYGCSSLSNLTLGESITDLDESCFEGCTSLTRVELPESTTKLDGYAFKDCTSLEYIKLSDNIPTISCCAFEGCTSLDNVVLPSNLQVIEKRAFANCSSLSEIVIPESCTNLSGYETFIGCESLTKVVLPEALLTIPDGTFMDCSSLTDITIPSGVRKIGGDAFRNCTSLTELTLPEKLVSIGSSAFSGSGIVEITIPDTVTDLGEGGLFNDCYNLEKVTFPESMTLTDNTFYGGFSNCVNLKELTIPEGITKIEQDAISSAGITTLTLPSTLTYMDYQAVGNLENLNNLYILSEENVDYDSYFLEDLGGTNLTIFAPADSPIAESLSGGDVNVVNSSNEALIQAMLAKKSILGLSSAYNSQIDLNQDGTIDILDYLSAKANLIQD